MLYMDACIAVDKVKSKKINLKTAIFDGKGKNKKLLYALVCESLKYWPVLEKIVTNTALCKREKLLREPTLACILVYDFLFGKGIHGALLHKKAVERHKTVLRAELARIKIKAGVTTNAALIVKDEGESDILPRYVRVNTLKTTIGEVVQIFKETFIHLPHPETYDGYQRVIESLGPKEFVQDFHMDELLVFSRKADIHKHPLYAQGHIILQDKASCVPAAILAPPPGSIVIDTCAAPGNKTSHLAAIMGGKGKLFAFERDGNRVETLGSQMSKAGVECVKVQHQDFLKVSPDDATYANVQLILVDPSCSGSGIVGRGDELTPEKKPGSKEQEDRIEKLANFQATLVKHALRFHAVQRLVYSTCSVYERENEAVVLEVLKESQMFGLVNIDSRYKTRGLASSPVGRLCLRFGPDTDHTNGFFVALFCKVCPESKGEMEVITYEKLMSGLGAQNTIDNSNSKGKGKRKKGKKNKESNCPSVTQKELMNSLPSVNSEENLRAKKRKQSDTLHILDENDEPRNIPEVNSNNKDKTKNNKKKTKKRKTKRKA